MDFRLTDDQQLLHETTRKFLESTVPVETVRRIADDEPAGFDATWWTKGADLGWTSLLVPEEDGGGSVSGHGLLDLVLVAEEMGRLVSPGPLVPTNVVAQAVARLGTTQQRKELLPDLLSGTAVATWCLGAPASGIDPGGRVQAMSGDAGFVLDGVTGPVEAAGQADLFLVTATTAAGLAQFVVPAGAAGVSVKEANSFDLVRRFAQVQFDEVMVGPDAVLGEQGGGPTDVEHQLQTVVVLQCAEMVGAMDRVFGFTVDYAVRSVLLRAPAGLVPGAEAQVRRHEAVAGSLTRHRHRRSSGGGLGLKHAPELISVAKAYIGERGPAILQDCVQLHGGIGVTWDHDLHLYLRRVVVDRTQWGTPRDHRERVAVAMGMDEGEDDR